MQAYVVVVDVLASRSVPMVPIGWQGEMMRFTISVLFELLVCSFQSATQAKRNQGPSLVRIIALQLTYPLLTLILLTASSYRLY